MSDIASVPGTTGRLARLALGLVLMACALWAVPAGAADPAPAFAARAEALVRLLNGDEVPEKLFTPAFLAQVPPAQVAAISRQLRDSYGAAERVTRIDARTPLAGLLTIAFARAEVRMQMSVAADPPQLVDGLLVTGADMKSDDGATILRDLEALPGEVSLAAATLGPGGPEPLPFARAADRPMAVGSSFKLFILAELMREIRAGERRWGDVVPLGPVSLPSGILQDWPPGSPLTLHSLAVLMISRSDNSAADTLLAALGREKVEQLLPELGVRHPERLRPFLSTRETFALKLGDAARLRQWQAGDEAARRVLVSALAPAKVADLDLSLLAAGPRAIDVEWFASTGDLVRTLDWLRRNGDETLLALLAINPGTTRDLAGKFAYLGYKGGSEPGVLNLSYLMKRRDGHWAAVSATWNDPAAAIDEARFALLVQRVLARLAD